jgi:uncharacterized protein (TIGR02444 family)
MAAADTLDIDNALWRFVLPFYGRPGVAPACLTLQERLGVDVNILLFAIFAQIARGIALDPEDLATVDALVHDWRDEVVRPLRAIRSRMKSGPSPAPSATTEPLRGRIKAAELEAEQIELALLFEWLGTRPPRAVTPIAKRDIPQTVARYFASGPLAPEVEAALEVLSSAMRDTCAEQHQRA